MLTQPFYTRPLSPVIHHLQCYMITARIQNALTQYMYQKYFVEYYFTLVYRNSTERT